MPVRSPQIQQGFAGCGEKPGACREGVPVLRPSKPALLQGQFVAVAIRAMRSAESAMICVESPSAA
jgi:hypothetical protein